jgi:hypothetical protein
MRSLSTPARRVSLSTLGESTSVLYPHKDPEVDPMATLLEEEDPLVSLRLFLKLVSVSSFRYLCSMFVETVLLVTVEQVVSWFVCSCRRCIVVVEGEGKAYYHSCQYILAVYTHR